MSFADAGPAQLVFGGQTCPAQAAPAAIIPEAAALAVAFLESRLRGQPGVEPLTLAWAVRQPADQLTLALKQAPGPAPAA
jgi:hypothetical protein